MNEGDRQLEIYRGLWAALRAQPGDSLQSAAKRERRRRGPHIAAASLVSGIRERTGSFAWAELDRAWRAALTNKWSPAKSPEPR
jgi:hypothetical protein